jgi:hypothetical protein
MVVGPVAFRDFATSPVVIPLYAGNPKCRTPIPRDPLTRVLVMNGSDLIGKSWIAISCCTISLPSKTPKNKTPVDDARSFATCPRRWTVLIDSRGFGTYDVLVLMTSRTPDFPMGQPPMVLDGCHLSHRWTAVIVPGFSYGFPDSSQMTDTCPSL